MEPDIKIGIEVELDDLTETIRDLLTVKWRIENTNVNDLLWSFEFLSVHILYTS